MLIQLIAQQPQIIGSILKNTPSWVWGLLATLLVLGYTQLRTRTVSALRMTIMPLAMTGLSLWGTISAFSSSPLFGYVLAAWAVAASLLLGLIAVRTAPAGTAFDAASRSFTVPGSWVPMALILGIFLLKYTVGVELAMQPALAHDGQYTLIVGGLYGAFSGIFAGRAARLWLLALRGSNASANTSPATTPAATPALNA